MIYEINSHLNLGFCAIIYIILVEICKSVGIYYFPKPAQKRTNNTNQKYEYIFTSETNNQISYLLSNCLVNYFELNYLHMYYY